MTHEGKHHLQAEFLTQQGPVPMLSHIHSIVPVEAPSLRRDQQFDPEVGKKVCGTFTGTFRASNALYQRVLEVEETSGLTTTALIE